jgi:glycosyltransferase involved in cell wall biosynthesis
MSSPLVSCVMVTRNRAFIARRALKCFAEQTWPHKELVILDDGQEDYGPAIAEGAAALAVRYHREQPQPGRFLGGLRNKALELASGDYIMQWDDDEWYHPTRIEVQMRAIDGGLDAVALTNTLCHVDEPRYIAHPFHTERVTGAIPGTILHRRGSERYPNIARGEDSAFLDDLCANGRVGPPPGPHSHLFIRCFHGANTWDLEHFFTLLRISTGAKLNYFVARYLRGDIRTHRAFRLTALERESVARFLDDSRALGILKS